MSTATSGLLCRLTKGTRIPLRSCGLLAKRRLPLRSNEGLERCQHAVLRHTAKSTN